jgi:hypothetical protein
MTATQNYADKALYLLSELRKQKAQKAIVEQRIRETEKALTIHKIAGDLNDFTQGEAQNTIKYDGATFIYSPGRVSYDYSNCQDVQELEAQIKERKNLAAEMGLATQKMSKPSWSVRS